MATYTLRKPYNGVILGRQVKADKGDEVEIPDSVVGGFKRLNFLEVEDKPEAETAEARETRDAEPDADEDNGDADKNADGDEDKGDEGKPAKRGPGRPRKSAN